jgi:hypothetical protein
VWSDPRDTRPRSGRYCLVCRRCTRRRVWSGEVPTPLEARTSSGVHSLETKGASSVPGH